MHGFKVDQRKTNGIVDYKINSILTMMMTDDEITFAREFYVLVDDGNEMAPKLQCSHLYVHMNIEHHC